MKLTYLDKLVLHMALMEYLERRIGDPAQPDEQLADAAVDYVNRRYGNHDENFKDMKNAAVYLNCVRAKAILRTLSEGAFEGAFDEPCELERTFVRTQQARRVRLF